MMQKANSETTATTPLTCCPSQWNNINPA
jgi:hypothetical protein